MNYYNPSANSTPDDNNIDDRHPNGEEHPTTTAAEVTHRSYYGNPTGGCVTHLLVRPQSRCVHQNNQRSLTWNISLTDDQDEVSENILMMHNEPTINAEKFGLAILKIPAYIRKEADELFKLSEIDPNETFDMINFRGSWVLPSSYQQYLKSIPPKVLEKRESHVLYPWTLWNKSTGTQHSLTGNRAVASPVDLDRSFLHSSSLSPPPSSSSISPQYVHAVFGRSSNNNSSSSDNNNISNSSSSGPNDNSSSSSGNNNSSSSSSSGNNNSSSGGGNNNNNSSIGSSSSGGGSNNNNYRMGYCFSEQMSYLCRTPADARYCRTNTMTTTTTTTPQQQQQQRFVRNDRGSGAQRPLQPTWIARSPQSDFDRSISSADSSCRDRLMPSSLSSLSSPSPPPPPRARVYYSVNTNSNTVNKLVEHYCTFCYKNHEPPEVYGSHLVRDAVRTTCPKLRALSCRHCNGTGDGAHTIKYCPFLYANYK